MAGIFPELPEPFKATEGRVERLQHVDAKAQFAEDIERARESASKPWAGWDVRGWKFRIRPKK
ncbi:hypothetical protein L198_04816 [Cryptococcus wingfieldii CBS 7118]|uniref:Uncharacterized protein n=1 Tax=Cryptococcus wingfieldii CBS 7118 TaxID=1295528 RepID=A0A1E3J1Y8_9TREE|nr:hypothetical protein L198_04816 [Cryptococcus wingfieldii CBS 7118]ODN94675.1 hypothetical protein L198_04816 [Cryptococcus wingfieldii CBS 7118]